MRVNPVMILCFAYSLKFSLSTSDADNNTSINNTTEKDPLILTPLIDKGEIDEARRQALVHHEEMQNVESYSGYFTVNKTYNSNIFFWYHPAQKKPVDAPVLLYQSGGPGGSSLMTIFNTGPFVVTENFTLKTREHSWCTHHHIIYLESPIGTSFSFTDDDAALLTNQEEVGRDLLLVLLQFLQLFPELRKNDLYTIADSYGGKFALSASKAIKQHNDASETKINLAGIVIVNGELDPQYQMAVGDYWYATGLIDTYGRDEVMKIETEVQELVKQQKYEEATITKDKIIMKLFTKEPTLFENLTGYSNYHFNVLRDQPPEIIARVTEFSDSESLRKSLHVGNRRFSRMTEEVMSRFKNDMSQTMVPVLADLLRHYRILMLYGQMDTIVPYPRAEEMCWNLDWPGVAEYRKAERRKWRVIGNLAGYVKSGGNLTQVMLRKAGHELIFDQPLWILNMLNQFTGAGIL